MVWLLQGSLSLLKTFSAVKQGLKSCVNVKTFSILLSHDSGRGGGGLEMPIIGQLDNGTLARMRQETYNDDDEL
jgi:hypothetical protein